MIDPIIFFLYYYFEYIFPVSIMSNKQKIPPFSHYAIPKITGTCSICHDFFHQGKTLHQKANSILSINEKNQFDIFYIEKGEVQIIFENIKGQQRTIISFGEGGIFNIAPAALLQDTSGQYQCKTDSIIHSLPAHIVLAEETIQENPELAISLIKHLSRLTLTYSTLLTDLQIDTFFHRFCRYLLCLQLQHGRKTFPLDVSQDHLATILGVHRATLARAIQKLKKLNVITKFSNKTVEICDLETLRQLAEL